MDTKETRAWNVRDVQTLAIHKFKAACYSQGVNMGEMISKLMLEWVQKSEKKAAKKG